MGRGRGGESDWGGVAGRDKWKGGELLRGLVGRGKGGKSKLLPPRCCIIMLRYFMRIILNFSNPVYDIFTGFYL